MELKNVVSIVIQALEDKKAENIQIIDISEISSVADYFIITNGNNPSQVQALADNVMEQLAKIKVNAKQVEGYQSANWILQDYSDFIVHIFDKESRGFYDLERIWRDGRVLPLDTFQE